MDQEILLQEPRVPSPADPAPQPGPTPARPAHAADPVPLLHRHQGLDQVLGSLSNGLLQFSMMADAKANIMITVSSVVLTISLTQLDEPDLRLPLLCLSAFTLGALMLAILCVVPAYVDPTPGSLPGRPRGTPLNPFFFLHFRAWTTAEYVQEMRRVLADDVEMYTTWLRDIHQQGLSLSARKYRLLRWSYLLFLAGVVSAAMLLIRRLIFGGP